MTAPVDLDCILCACEVAVLRALEVAGNRGRDTGRDNRAVNAAAPAHTAHTRRRLAYTHDACDKLVRGAWDHLQLVYPNEPRLIRGLDWYVRQLIVTQSAHTRAELAQVLAVVYEPVTTS